MNAWSRAEMCFSFDDIKRMELVHTMFFIYWYLTLNTEHKERVEIQMPYLFFLQPNISVKLLLLHFVFWFINYRLVVPINTTFGWQIVGFPVRVAAQTFAELKIYTLDTQILQLQNPKLAVNAEGLTRASAWVVSHHAAVKRFNTNASSHLQSSPPPSNRSEGRGRRYGVLMSSGPLLHRAAPMCPHCSSLCELILQVVFPHFKVVLY